MRATDVTVLVAGSANPTGHGIAQALNDADDVVGYDACEASDNPSNLWCSNVRVPRTKDPSYKDAVLALVRQHRPLAIIPSNDHDLRALLAFADELRSAGVILNGDGPNVRALLDKRMTSSLFTAEGVQTPPLVTAFDDRFPYVVRKQRVGDGRKTTFVVEDAVAEATMPPGSYDPNDAVLTRYVEGDEFTIDVLCDQASNVLSVVPRLRREVRYGMVHRGEVVRDELVIARTRELAERVQLRGINCVQCIRTPHDAWFFEVNCRPGSGSSLSLAAGVNMPVLWVASLLGTPIPAPDPTWGMKMTRFFEGYYHL